jgi:hypothetical protein
VFPPLSFASPAPLEGTATSHEYHAEFAEKESQTVRPPAAGVKAGVGSWVFVMARAWRPAGRPAGDRSNPADGVVLRGLDGREVFDFSRARFETYPDSPENDRGGGGTIEVTPGLYLLERPGAGGVRLTQTITAVVAWVRYQRYQSRLETAAAERNAKEARLINASWQLTAGKELMTQARVRDTSGAFLWYAEAWNNFVKSADVLESGKGEQLRASYLMGLGVVQRQLPGRAELRRCQFAVQRVGEPGDAVAGRAVEGAGATCFPRDGRPPRSARLQPRVGSVGSRR